MFRALNVVNAVLNAGILKNARDFVDIILLSLF